MFNNVEVKSCPHRGHDFTRRHTEDGAWRRHIKASQGQTGTTVSDGSEVWHQRIALTWLVKWGIVSSREMSTSINIQRRRWQTHSERFKQGFGWDAEIWHHFQPDNSRFTFYSSSFDRITKSLEFQRRDGVFLIKGPDLNWPRFRSGLRPPPVFVQLQRHMSELSDAQRDAAEAAARKLNVTEGHH